MSEAAIRSAQNLGGRFFYGSILVQFYDADALTWGPAFGPVNAVRLGINPGNSTLVERKLRTLSQRGQIGDSVVQELGTPVLGIDLDEVEDSEKKGLLVAQFRGTATDRASQSASTAVKTVKAVSSTGDWIKLDHTNVATAGFAGFQSDGTTPLVAGTDYILDAGLLRYGWVYIPSGSSATGDCQWDYTYGNDSGIQIVGNALAQVKIKIHGFMKDLANGGNYYLLCHEVVVNEGNEINFQSDEFLTPSFTGTMVTPSGETGPYYIYTHNFS